MRTSIKFLLTALVLILGGAHTAFAIPADELLKSLRPNADVNDFAGLLSPVEREQLEARCRQLRERTGAELAVVTVKSLDGGQIDDFANKLFKRWGIGQRDKKNGVLLLVAIADRKARIEVGYGLEPIIPDALSGRMIDHDLIPQFRDKHYAAGLQATVNSICERIESGKVADRDVPAGDNQPAALPGLVLVLAIVVAFSGLIFGAGLGLPQIALAAIGLVVGGGCILASLAAAGPPALLFHLPAAIFGTTLGWRMARGGFQSPTRRYWNTSPWSWGDYSGSSGGGWSSGGGGFSQGWGGFGGGSSGGGGASGGW